MSIEINLAGKTAAVTGGGRGLGKAIALTLARAGANVWIGNRKEEQAEQTVKEIQEMGGKAGYTVMDVANFDDVQRFMDDAEKFGNGKLDIMVNNAGVIGTDSFLDTTVDEFKRQLDINVVGVSNALQIALKKMIPNKAGKIVVIPSIAGRKGASLLSHYSATKAAAINLTQSAAYVAAPYRINVNGVAPGIIRTPMWEEILDGVTPEGVDRDENFDNFIKALIPLGVPQTEQNIADAVLFFCSDLADEITGQTLNVDGGAAMN